MTKKIVLYGLSAIVGLVFIFSAYTKLFPVEPFEYTFLDFGLNWYIAPFASRILIGLEFLIGLAFLSSFNYKKWNYKLSISLLLIFCVYLAFIILVKDNKGNCGCFGTVIEMTPLQAIIKNALLLIVILILYKYHLGWHQFKYNKYILYTFFIAVLSVPFILNPIKLNYSEAYLNRSKENLVIPLDTLYNNATLTKPPKSLSKGKHIIAFLSLKCKHCKMAAKRMQLFHYIHPEVPIYFVFNGEESDIPKFVKEVDLVNIPYTLLNGRGFVYMAGVNLPVIYLINNGQFDLLIDYLNFDEEEIINWYKDQKK